MELFSNLKTILYEFVCEHRINKTRKKIKVASLEETIEKIKNENCSISRFGDGEVYIMDGNSIGFQEYDKELANRLKEVIASDSHNHLVCISNAVNPKNYCEYTIKHREWLKKNFKITATARLKYLRNDKKYYNAMISRFWIPFKDKERAKRVAEELKKIWQDRNVIVVEGEKTRMGVGNDLLKKAKSVKRILCPAESAFAKYDETLNACLEMPKDSLFLIALGPTASVLAYDLYKSGYQALDIGHIDLEYEWMKMGVTEQVNLPNKYVNELSGGRNTVDIADEVYLSEIIYNLNS